ncbi:MAG: hypothetical protein NXH87_11870 [Rhodobiaceae bacterium]|nr:hypothetical protein [Rhodobiaceae bacterium]
MKILFLENRAKTALWERVALDLGALGHEISWLIQNPEFGPRQVSDPSKIHVLPFPQKAHRKDPEGAPDEWAGNEFPVLVTDRGRTHFDAGTSHYEHYASLIARVMDRETPDLVVGECTLFHELLTLDLCRHRGILYVHPCANRYPAGRFSIFSYDTQNPVLGAGDEWDEGRACEYVDRIVSGRETPSYMRKSHALDAWKLKARLVSSRVRALQGRLRGEHFNTPSLGRKLVLERQLREKLRRWDQLQKRPMNPAKTVLYPLQMQPEANIDVWGRPYSDQVAVVEEMLVSSPDDVQIAIKSNPKSKYEVSGRLMELAYKESRLCLLPRTCTMTEAQSMTCGSLTVCGTVAFEAVFGKGRCISLKHPLIEREFPHIHADCVADAVDRLLNSESDGLGDTKTGTKLIQLLVAQSFPGVVSDQVYQPDCLARENTQMIASALNAVTQARSLNQVSQ